MGLSASPTVGATAQPLPPQAEPDALAPDETTLFCICAHMSGLPLNGAITGRGGRFLPLGLAAIDAALPGDAQRLFGGAGQARQKQPRGAEDYLRKKHPNGSPLISCCA